MEQSTKRPHGRAPMTLDLGGPAPAKRTRVLRASSRVELLSSPDLHKLKLASPDLERFITNSTPHSLANNPVTPSIFFPKNVTEEQELYAKGFEDALAQLKQDSHSNSNNSMDDSSMDSSSLDYGDAPSTTNPIDMASQEKIKLERKRQRNRIAASKCRKRKLERIAKLEDKVKLLKGDNEKLTDVLSRLKGSVEELKSKILMHVNQGCEISMP